MKYNDYMLTARTGVRGIVFEAGTTVEQMIGEGATIGERWCEEAAARGVIRPDMRQARPVTAPPPPPPPPADPPPLEDEPDVTDAAMCLIVEHDLDLSQIEGTGKGGRITADDVHRYMAQG